MATIFNSNINDISFDDIEALVTAKVPESQVLDYKKEFHKEDALKLISAMANTYGGIIVYGVECDSKTNLPLSTVDIPDKKLDDTITSISTYSITPPVFCEPKYCESKDGQKTVLIVRVPESSRTPHAINHNKDVYVKIQSQKRPLVERVDLDKLDWLRDKRREHVKLRDLLMNESQSRLNEFAESQDRTAVRLDIIVVPVYPGDPLIGYSEIERASNEVLEDFRSKHNSLIHLVNPFHFIGGIGRHDIRANDRYHAEMGTHGNSAICFLASTFVDAQTTPPRTFLSPRSIAVLVRWGLGLASMWVESLGVKGSVLAKVQIDNIRQTWLSRDAIPGPGVQLPDRMQCVVANSCTFSEHSLHGFSAGDVRAVCSEFIAQLVFLYGLNGRLRESAEGIYDLYLPEALKETVR